MTFYIVKSSVSAICSNNRLLVRASDGRLWSSFLWANDVYVAYSDDAGATWTLELVTIPDTVSYPTMAIDSADNLHIVWRQKIGADYNIHYRKRNASGVWDAEEVVSVDPGQQGMPTVAIDSSDNVHVIWESTNDPGLPRTHVLKYRMRTAVGWGAIESVSDPLPVLTYMQRNCLAIGSDDVVHVAWTSQLLGVAAYNIQYKQRIAGVWQAQEGVTDIAATQMMPQMAIDSSNDVHLTFYGGGWGANPGFYNMRYIKRTAGVWGASEAITDIAAHQNYFGSLMYHSIALDVAGDIHAVWSGLGWGANPLDRNVQYKRKSGGVWQAQEGLTDRNTHQGSVSLIWAMFPLISGVRTNIPFTGYAFILHGDDWGMDKVEYGPASTFMVIPTVTTDLATGTSTLNGTLDDDGGEACDCGFEWGLTVAYGNTTLTQSRTTGQTFAQTIGGLAQGTLYHFRAFATNGVGTSYGADRTFTTPVTIPIVTTDLETGLGRRRSVLNGTLDDDGGEVCDCGFEWGFDTGYGLTTPSQSKVTAETFAVLITSLFPETTYHFRAFATNSHGTGYGDDRSFTTKPVVSRAYALAREEL